MLKILDLPSKDWYRNCSSLFMTLCYFNIMFLVFSRSMLDIVIIDNEFMHKIGKLLAQYSSELSGRHYVSMVLRYCLPADAFCTLVMW